MKVQKLFEITFIDNTKLWASVNVENNISKLNTICFGTFGKGINTIVKTEIFHRIDKTKICSFATDYANSSKYVKSFTDFIEAESNEIQKQLLKAF